MTREIEKYASGGSSQNSAKLRIISKMRKKTYWKETPRINQKIWQHITIIKSREFTEDQSISISWWEWKHQAESRYDRCHCLTSNRSLESVNNYTRSASHQSVRHRCHTNVPLVSFGTISQFRLVDCASQHGSEWCPLLMDAYIEEMERFLSSGLSWGMPGILVSPLQQDHGFWILSHSSNVRKCRGGFHICW